MTPFRPQVPDVLASPDDGKGPPEGGKAHLIKKLVGGLPGAIVLRPRFKMIFGIVARRVRETTEGRSLCHCENCDVPSSEVDEMDSAAVLGRKRVRGRETERDGWKAMLPSQREERRQRKVMESSEMQQTIFFHCDRCATHTSIDAVLKHGHVQPPTLFER